MPTALIDEESVHSKLFPCTTCQVEVRDHDQALQCELYEQWEHVECIKVCDRPSLELYTVLSVLLSNAIVFTCTSRVPSRHLAEAEITLSSLHTQINVYQQLLHKCQQLLHECQQLVGCMTSERDGLQLLQLENAELWEQLAKVCELIAELRAKQPVSSGTRLTKPLSVSAPKFVSAILSSQPSHVIETPRAAMPFSGEVGQKLPALPTPVSLSSAVDTSLTTTVVPVVHSTPITSVSAAKLPVSTLLPPVSTLSLEAATPQAPHNLVLLSTHLDLRS